MPWVTFLPDGARLEVPVGCTLLAAALRAGRPIGYACRGRGVCVACRLRVEGEVSPPTPGETRLLATLPAPAAYRIACLCRIAGDCRVRADYW
ncbi:(2Fe-2S)-binding protein [Myxococcota bacterium]|nr:(2Fe-2S)-binding protein [Myxococcota bacterium]